MKKIFKKILDIIFLPFSIIAVIFAGIAIISNFLFTPKLFQRFTELFPQLFSKKLFIISLLILMFAIGGILAWQYREIPEREKVVITPEEKIKEVTPEKIAEDETADWKTYKNEEYGYEFKYPKDYVLKEVLGLEGAPTGTLLLRKKAKETEWLIEVFVQKDVRDALYDTSKMSFIEFAVDRILAYCAADGPMGSIYCTDVISQETFINNQGVEGYKIYITEVTESYKTEGTEISERTRGPIFAFDVSKQTDLARGLFFQRTRVGEESLEKENLMKVLNQIVSTLRFLE